jgi:eukaryotic-like serine/threonine-protein kinase
VDARSDLYSVGITMYELLAGCLPFEDESAYVLMHSQLNDAPRPPVEVNPNLSKALNDLILKALEKDPLRRFQSAAEFSQAIEKATGVKATLTAGRYTIAGRTSASIAVPKHSDHSAQAAATARFALPRRRKMWVAAEVSAATVLLAATAIGLSHAGLTKAVVRNAEHVPTALPTMSTLAPAESATKPASLLVEAPMALAEPIPMDIPQTRTERKLPSEQPHIRTVQAPRNELRTASVQETVSDKDADGPGEVISPAASAPAATTELKTARDEMAKLTTRAAAVRVNVLRVKAEREAAGDGLDQDMAAAYVRMNAYLSAERSDLTDGDLAAARDHMGKAASEVGALETMFGGTPKADQLASRR